MEEGKRTDPTLNVQPSAGCWRPFHAARPPAEEENHWPTPYWACADRYRTLSITAISCNFVQKTPATPRSMSGWWGFQWQDQNLFVSNNALYKCSLFIKSTHNTMISRIWSDIVFSVDILIINRCLLFMQATCRIVREYLKLKKLN